MSATDPFAPAPDEGIPRNGRGQPLITPTKRDGTPNPKGKPVPYVRASSFAKALDDGGGLTKWKVRHAIVGLASSPDLAAMVAAMGRDLNAFDVNDKRALDAIIERCHDRSGGNAKADYGTAVHSVTEPGRDPFIVDADDDGPHAELRRAMLADAAAYDGLLAELGLVPVDTEAFIVNDDLKAAGTYDHLYRCERAIVDKDGKEIIPAGTVVVGDKKTGRLSLGPHAIQLATYARGRKYDHATGEREAGVASPTHGIVVHVPKGEARAVAIVVDLVAGWKDAKLALDVRERRSAAYERSLGTVVGEYRVEKVDEPTPAIGPAAPKPGDVHPDGTVEAEVVDYVPGQDPFDPAAPADRIPAAEPVVERPAIEPPPASDHTPEPQKPAQGVDEFGDPIPDPTLTVADATANLARAGLEPTDALLDAISKATTADECRVLWSTNRSAWDEGKHTPAVKRRLVELGAT